jgi:hypothetical protein
VLKAQIAAVQADKKMPAKDRKQALADMNEALKTPGARDREQGQYRPRDKILRQARRRLAGRSIVTVRSSEPHAQPST